MPIKPTLTAAEFGALAPPERFAYVERDGHYVVELADTPEGYVRAAEHDDLKKSLAEFRDHNRSLHSKLAEAEAKLSSLAAKVVTGEAHEQKLADLQAALEREQQAHRAAQLKGAVVPAFGAVGGEPRAVDYIVALAAETFSVDAAGKLITKARGADGAVLTVESWLAAKATSHPFLFKPSRGGGAGTMASASRESSTPRIDGSDPVEFGRNLERIATGAVVVR